MTSHRGPAVILLAILLAGCGALSSRPRSGAEPAQSPAPRRPPAGRLVHVGALPEGIAVAPRLGFVAVATRRPNSIVVLDAADGAVLWRLALPGHARHLAVAGPAGPLLVPAETANRLVEVDLISRRTVSVPVGRLPHDVVQAAGRLFVTDEFGRTVTVIDRRGVVGRIAGFRQPGGIAATGRDVAIIDVGADTVTLVNATTLRRIATAPAGTGPTHAVADAQGNVYVIDTRGQALEVFATRPRLLLRSRLPLPGIPYGVAVDPVRRRLWITLTATNELAELSIAGGTPRLIARYATAQQPNTVAVDPRTGTVFVADAAQGSVEVIKPPKPPSAGGLGQAIDEVLPDGRSGGWSFRNVPAKRSPASRPGAPMLLARSGRRRPTPPAFWFSI